MTAHLEPLADAACVDADPDMFFPPTGGPSLPALRICLQVCKVTVACWDRHQQIDDGLDALELASYSNGVVAGTTSTDRDQIRRGRLTVTEAHLKHLARLQRRAAA